MSFIKLKAENQLKFEQYSTPAHTTVERLRHEMSDFIIAPDQWLPHISDFCHVDNRILTVLQEWVYQQPVWDVDELRRCLWLTVGQAFSRRSLIKWFISDDVGCWRYEIRPRWTAWTFDIYCPVFTTALRCCYIRFRMELQYFNIGDGNDHV